MVGLAVSQGGIHGRKRPSRDSISRKQFGPVLEPLRRELECGTVGAGHGG
jgi:hypothetical protein